MCRCLLLLLWTAAQFGQSQTGELRLSVSDPSGLPVQSAVELVSEANQLRQRLETDAKGTVVARRLPFGAYRIVVSRDGFAAFSDTLEVRSALPTLYHATLSLAPLQTQVTVGPGDDTLIDLHRTTATNRLGAETLQRRTMALPGRSVPDLVNTQPGWLLEANGILHPRGSEYQVQYVVDGLPLTDNRSPAFAPSLEADDAHSMTVLTAGYPAEYGRKLGGVIEVVTVGQARSGLHGSVLASGGSFGTATGSATIQYGRGRHTFGLSANVARTDRYLDPPVEENYTNHGSTTSVAAHFERELTESDRFGLIVRRGQAQLLVPNERIQQEAGQRQDRFSRETAAQFSYQHIFSPNVLGDVRGMVRDLSGGLWSNPLATPILAEQQRGFREVYVKGAIAGHRGMHDWKAGFDAGVAGVRETFAYRITDPTGFDRDTARDFHFADRRRQHEQALFVQDLVRLGAWTINAGVRWDRYQLVVDDRAISPRLGLAWSRPEAGLVLRASYDRAFQTPAVENLLLASSPEVDSLNDDVVRLPVQASRGNFYEVGLSKSLFGKMRLDANYFVRHIDELADDEVLLNTGVSFPIAFRTARIAGTEIKLEIPRWGGLSGFVSYANTLGVGYLPITGGLLLDDEAEALLESTERFPISQDQRHTLRGRASYQVTPRAWVAAALAYGSGLPVEFTDDREEAVESFGERIVDRVDFARRRVRPSFSLDASVGLTLSQGNTHAVRLQADGLNLTNRLNVINFSGLFSGTALAPPRSFAVRVQVEY